VRNFVLALLVAGIASAGYAADRKWQSGTWSKGATERIYIVDTPAFRYELQDTASEAQSIELASGATVKYALEGSTMYVLDSKGAEHSLRLSRTSDKTYSAVGSGHLIRSVSENGQYVTLEDGSVWDVDPRMWFRTMHWQPMAGIAVRKVPQPEDGFNYEIANIDEDEGTLAKYTVR
jgi:hypothetical protein